MTRHCATCTCSDSVVVLMLRPYGPGYIGATMKTNPTASSGFHTTRISPENIIAVGQYDSDGTLVRELPRDAWPE